METEKMDKKEYIEWAKSKFEDLANYIKVYIDNKLKTKTENIDKYIIDFKLNYMIYRVIRMNCHGRGYNLSVRYSDEPVCSLNQIHPSSTSALSIVKIINAIKEAQDD